MKWLSKKFKKKKPSPFPDLVRYPYGSETLEKSHETPRGIHPPSEVTRNENPYTYETTSPGERHPEDLEYGTPYHSYPPRSDYESTWPISVTMRGSCKKWLNLKK